MNKYETKLFEISNPEEGKKRDLYDYNNTESCDLCTKSLAECNFFIDGEVRGSLSWANMCPKCFSTRGSSIRWGKGQLYMKQPDGSWVMSAGFPPEDIEEDEDW
ncbi:MAG: hypothetical protein CO158_02120 [Piscirickettsiaceae bacterium CG_4_9_14_3_um_filter_43_564]|nr:MAG: hypothetical protein COW74_02100 [Piscirickettsiaceae bacterium CG18_big_fil_WC_8_21_14_2_50_44_103]PIU38738.1 MAG: hypothetical protein COT01_05220 [Piscirickettsiaceae bacterium CG07_land_8_20_14_0_80_44_28]PJA66660.1 MAG: hypothetical protein CO158_02120 [Piscirickettsiaceae bacterium CG_4_9_14_3_um_filter_43_564]